MSAARGSRTEKAVLIVLFIPSVDRDERSIDQDRWTARALEVLGVLFGGATAFPRARGVWRDDERDERLVWDEPVVIHCYASVNDVRRNGSSASSATSAMKWAASATKVKSA